MKIEINIERKHLYGVIVLLTLGFFIMYTISTPIKKSTGSHPLQQIAIGIGPNPLDSVDSDANGFIDNSDSCSGDSVCEVKNIYATGNISISDGNPHQFRLNVSGKILATTPLDSDPDNTVVTKGYLEAMGGGGFVTVASNDNEEYTEEHVEKVRRFIERGGLIVGMMCRRPQVQAQRRYWGIYGGFADGELDGSYVGIERDYGQSVTVRIYCTWPGNCWTQKTGFAVPEACTKGWRIMGIE